MTIFGFGKKTVTTPHRGGARSFLGTEPTVRIWTEKTTRRLYKVAFWAALLLLVQSIFLLMIHNDFDLRLNLLMQMAALILFGLFCRGAAATYLNAPVVFASSIFIWHSPLLVGYYFNVDPLFNALPDRFDIGFQYVYKAVALIGLSLSLAIIGMLWGYRRHRMEIQTNPSRNTLARGRHSWLGPASKRVGWYLFSGMMLILVSFVLWEGPKVFAGEYIDLYANAPSSFIGILFFRSELFWVFVIVLLIACYRDNPLVRNFLAVCIVVICVLLAMMGPRTGPFVCLTSLVLSWDCFVQRVKLRWIGGFVLVLMVASFIIVVRRQTSVGANILQFSGTGLDQFQLLTFFYEQGKSIIPLLRAMDFTQNGGFQYGRTLVDAIISVIPLPVLKLVGYSPAITLADWVVANSPDVPLFEGLGSSLIAELYYNFGVLGCLGFLITGWYIGRAYFKYALSGDMFTGLKVMTVVAAYTVMMRNDLEVCCRLLVYAFIIVGLLRRQSEKSFISQRRVRNKNSAPKTIPQASTELVRPVPSDGRA